MNKIVQDLKMEWKTVNKTQHEALLEMKNRGKRTRTIKVNITNTIQDMQEKISGIEDTIEEIIMSLEDPSSFLYTRNTSQQQRQSLPQDKVLGKGFLSKRTQETSLSNHSNI
jgi:predicted  nucleic acid-binding Zn-ribbon protein